MTEKKLAQTVEKYIDRQITDGVFEPDEVAIEIASMAIKHFHTVHSKALACHCECLGMNAENSYAVCQGSEVPYSQAHYGECLMKWGLMNEKGESLI